MAYMSQPCNIRLTRYGTIRDLPLNLFENHSLILLQAIERVKRN